MREEEETEGEGQKTRDFFFLKGNNLCGRKMSYDMFESAIYYLPLGKQEKWPF